jgi:hypothetical protein
MSALAIVAENEVAARWPDPVTFGAGPDLDDIPADLLPAPVGPFCKAVADELQVPEAMPVLMALAVLATARQRRFEVKPTHESNYHEPLSFWANVLMTSANRKSATLARLTAPLYAWEKRAGRVIKPAADQNATERAVREKRVAKLTNEASACDDDNARRAKTDEIARLQSQELPELFPPRLVTGDTTPERLEQMLVEQGGRMALFSAEGGIFAIWCGIYSDGAAKNDVFLQAHAGEQIRIDRASREAHVDRAAFSCGLVIQPGILEDLPDSQRRRLRNSGMLARFAFAMPKSQVGFRQTRLVRPVPMALREAYDDAIAGLLPDPSEIVADAVDGDPAPVSLYLSPDALEVWQQFQEDIEPRMRPDGNLTSILDWAGKLPGMALRIAGLIHPLQSTGHEIGKDAMQRAVALAHALIPHARAVFDGLGGDAAQADARKLFAFLLGRAAAGDVDVSKTDLTKAVHGHLSGARLDRAIQALQDRAILGQGASVSTGGRSRMMYPINPRIAA